MIASNHISFVDWLSKSNILTPGKRSALRFIATRIEDPEHWNDFRFLEFHSATFSGGEYYGAFLHAWDQYGDFLQRLEAQISTTPEFVFEHDGVSTRIRAAGYRISATYLYMETGCDPLGIFSEDDLPAIRAVWEMPPQLQSREEVIQWLEDRMKDLDRARDPWSLE